MGWILSLWELYERFFSPEVVSGGARADLLETETSKEKQGL
jgi:hypothetical protein